MTATQMPDAPQLSEEEYPILIDAFIESQRHLDFLLCGYILMPDHWHALLWPSFPLTLSRMLQDVRTRTTRSLNRQRGTRGTFAQNQFWDRFVRNKSEFNKRLEYMHLNPVRRGLVARPEDWRWSSYNNVSLDKSVVAACPIQIDYVHLSDAHRG